MKFSMAIFMKIHLPGSSLFKIEKDEVDIHRLVVSPDYFHKGIATKLLLYVFDMFSPPKHILYKQGKKIHLLFLYIKNMALLK